jgi:hypothetical protein
MHGTTVKIIEAQQAKVCNTHKNTKLKLLKTNHHYHHHISVMELGHLLTHSGLTYPEENKW